MPAVTMASLRARIKRCEQEVQRRQQQNGSYRPNKHIPGVDRWPEFARLTWIKTSGKVAQFDPYSFQIDLIDAINTNPNTIVNKSRQMGISETIVSYLACRAATEPGFAGVIFSKTQNDASELGRRVRFMLNSIEGTKFKYATDSTVLISIIGGGTLYFLPGSPRAARGIPSGSVLWLDEAAFIDGADEIYRGAMPILSMVGDAAKVIITSTPDTSLDFFGRLWHLGIPPDWYSYITQSKLVELNQRLDEIEDDWHRVAIHYSQHPVYSKDPSWAEKTRESRRMTRSAWASEYELSFGSTDTQVFPHELVQRASIGHWRECGVIRRNYIVAVDPNGGGNDYFVALVMDITEAPYEVVAMYRENGKSTNYSLGHVAEMIENFLPSKVIVEKQAMGSVIAEALLIHLPSYAITTFNTTRPSKMVATDRILYLLEREQLIFPAGIIGDELMAFQQKDDGKREAAPGCHDDTVSALWMACSLIPDDASVEAFFKAL